MWIIRVIIVIGILWCIAAIIGWIIRAALIKQVRKMQSGTKPKAEIEKPLVPCQRCRTFIDKSSAVEYKGKFYCSQDHLEQDKKD